jgi:tetratricopeptide (TPR) repeat protein
METGRPSYLKCEILQIGAIKVDENLKYVSNFKMYVRPKFLPTINKHVLEILNVKAFKAYEEGNLQSALETFLEILEKAPNDKDTMYNIARVLYDGHELKLCIDMLSRLLNIDDKDDSAYELLGDVFLANSQINDALLAYKKVSQRDLVGEKIKYAEKISRN